MSRRKMLIGNWKMHKTSAESRSFAEELGRNTGALSDALDYVICPPATSLYILRVVLPAKVALGAQNIHFEEKGAFTGEITAEMVRDLGARFAIIGHSERRYVFGESEEWIRRKVRRAVSDQLVPILCVGEDLGQWENDETLAVVREQTLSGLADLTPEEAARSIVAYEPVWAIGSGQTPTAEQAERVVSAIRNVVAEEKGTEAGEQVRILYGGSVKPENVALFVRQPNIDGVLVGGASLEVKSFVAMAEAIAGGEMK